MTQVSIGVPVLNGASVIEAALASLQAQTHRDLEIVVCDNASEDDTAAIVARIAKNDPRIVLRRFEERVDILASFRRAFESTGGEFFAFAPADDRWDPSFVARCLTRHQSEPGLAAVCARVAFQAVSDAAEGPGRGSYISFGTKELRGSPRDNLLGYLADPAENSRAFGLFRRRALVGAFPPRWYPGWDLQMIARSLKFGGYAELDEVLLWREATPLARYAAEFGRSRSGRMSRLLPHLSLARAIWKDADGLRGPALAWNLGLLVIRSHLNYAPVQWPRYGSLVSWLAWHLALRWWPLHCGPVLPEGQKPSPDWRDRWLGSA